MKELISVIVPVYNVERYLIRCISSIQNQSYSKLEIILVDDGSSDKSGAICDQLACLDNRLKVLHKSNGGLSDARNAGIKIASGKYITFVDGDDYLQENFIEYLYKILKQYDVDIAVGNMYKTNKDCESFVLKTKREYVLNNTEALKNMFYTKDFSTSACAKLFNINLFGNINFPVGKLYEDLFTLYKIINKSKIVFGNGSNYFYFRRPGSIMVSKYTTKNLDVIEALNNIYHDIVINEPSLFGAFNNLYAACIIDLIEKKPDKKIIEAYFNYLKDFRKGTIFDKNSLKRVKAFLILSYFGLRITMGSISLYYKLKWKN